MIIFQIKSEAAPSRVLHIRQISTEATENHIRVLGTPFGTIRNVIHMRSKNQAFLEMDSIESAKTLINYYQYTTPTILNMPVSHSLHTFKDYKNSQAS